MARPCSPQAQHGSTALTTGPALLRHRRGRRPQGFTLTEILVVIVIIVLILGMAVPALRFITGSRSQAGAANMISAMLARARNDAIGLQTPTGVCIYQDAATGKSMMVEVQQVQVGLWNSTSSYLPGTYVSYNNGAATLDYVCFNDVLAGTTAIPNTVPSGDTNHWSQISTTTSNANGFSYLVDQVPGTDTESLPVGVGVQAVTDPGASSAGVSYIQDRYLHTGVVLFDSNGRLIVQPYFLHRAGLIGIAVGYSTVVNQGTSTATITTGSIDIAQNQGTAITGSSYLNTGTPSPVVTPCTLSSSIGLVTYDRDSLASQGAPGGDYIINSAAFGSLPAITSYTSATSGNSDQFEEAWLDKNATPLLLNRYNGTLLSSQ